jgi:hypothetical protein
MWKQAFFGKDASACCVSWICNKLIICSRCQGAKQRLANAGTAVFDQRHVDAAITKSIEGPFES